MTKWAIGIDIGGTKIDVGHVDREGKLLERTVFPTPPSAPVEKIIHEIAQMVKTLASKAGSEPQAVGVGVAGQITPNTGIVQFAPNLIWRDVPLKKQLQDLISYPVYILNDVRAATWGEWQHGAGQGAQDVVCLLIGTGIGGGVVSQGNLITGASNSAGELGHVIIDKNGPPCTCGSQGCLEALASGWALREQARAVIEKDPKNAGALLESVQGHINDLTARHVVEVARTGDPLASSLIENAQAALNAGCISLINAFNPERLIIGGGLGLAIPHLIDNVKTAVLDKALKAATSNLQVVPASLATNAGVIGAASYAFHAGSKA